MARKGRYSFLKKTIISFFLISSIAGGYWFYEKYIGIYQPNVTLHGAESVYFYIKTGATLRDVVASLQEQSYIHNTASFEWVAERKNLKNNIHAGRYLIKENMNNNDLINLLRSGEQDPVKIVIGAGRTREKIAKRVAEHIEADSTAIASFLYDENFYHKYNLSNQTWMILFIPNTYEFFWNTSAEEFTDRMHKEYETFWNTERSELAKQIGLNRVEVATLASIIQQETQMNDEKPIIAGVYINRLNRPMRLEADPTLIFALGDFSITRVLDIHKAIDSPYNTYKNDGLPPGPICIPTIASLDAVLNYKRHGYYFFCAKKDFSGYHNFAKTYAQHRVNARKFQRELNKRKIWN